MLTTRGLLLRELGRLPQAGADFEQRGGPGARRPGCALQPRRLLPGGRQYGRALADLTHALELRPDHVPSLNNRGLARAMLRNPEGALADFDRSLALQPDQPRVLNNRGLVRRALHDLDGAISDFSRALGLEPARPDTLYNLGATRAGAGDPLGAAADFSARLDLLARRPGDHLSRGLGLRLRRALRRGAGMARPGHVVATRAWPSRSAQDPAFDACRE